MCNLNEAWNESEEDKHDDAERDEQCDERSFGGGFLEFLVVDDQDNRRNTQQVEQMDCHRNAYHVGNCHEIAVAVGLFAAVFPFKNKPERQGGAERREGVDFALYG